MLSAVSVLFYTILSQAPAFRIRILSKIQRADAASGCAEELQNELRFKSPFNVHELFSTGPSFTDKPSRTWDFAKDVTIIRSLSKRTTWGEVLTKEAYVLERERLKELTWQGKPLVDFPVSSNLRGVCDLSLTSLQIVVRSTILLRRIRRFAADCTRLSNSELVAALMSAIDSMCFDGCMNALRQKQTSHEPSFYDSEWFLKVFTETEDCSRVPWDTVEDLADLTLKQKLMQFPPPSPLWLPVDKAVGEFSQEEGVLPTCDISPLTHRATNLSGSTDYLGLQLNSKNVEEVKMWEMCPEGTYCHFPMTEVRGWPTVEELRGHKRLMYIVRGVAGVPSIIAQFPISYASSAASASISHNAVAALGSLIPEIAQIAAALGITAVTIPAALSATITVPTFVVSAAVALGTKAAWKQMTFSCQSTIGCWAPRHGVWIRSEKVKEWNCRMPEEVKGGGSPLWFLPPPGTMLKSKNRACNIRACTDEDLMMERVGFQSSKRYGQHSFLLNCQPLTIEEMHDTQLAAFVQSLRQTGVDSEYDLESVIPKLGEQLEVIAIQLDSEGRNLLSSIF